LRGQESLSESSAEIQPGDRSPEKEKAVLFNHHSRSEVLNCSDFLAARRCKRAIRFARKQCEKEMGFSGIAFRQILSVIQSFHLFLLT